MTATKEQTTWTPEAIVVGSLILRPTKFFQGIDLIPGSISIIAGIVSSALAQYITNNSPNYERTTTARWGLRFLACFLRALIIALPAYAALKILLQQVIVREKRELAALTRKNAYLKKVGERTRIVLQVMVLEMEKDKVDYTGWLGVWGMTQTGGGGNMEVGRKRRKITELGMIGRAVEQVPIPSNEEDGKSLES